MLPQCLCTSPREASWFGSNYTSLERPSLTTPVELWSPALCFLFGAWYILTLCYMIDALPLFSLSVNRSCEGHGLSQLYSLLYPITWNTAQHPAITNRSFYLSWSPAPSTGWHMDGLSKCLLSE